nr:hypothetical protein [Paraburkholderia sp. BL8N3]
MARVSARDDASGNGSRGGADSGSISVAPDKLNWDYNVEGRAEFTPETVFDDGHAVWCACPPKRKNGPCRLSSIMAIGLWPTSYAVVTSRASASADEIVFALG